MLSAGDAYIFVSFEVDLLHGMLVETSGPRRSWRLWTLKIGHLMSEYLSALHQRSVKK